MATRFYFPLDTVADVNPAPGAWNYITEAVFRYLAKTKGSSTITVGSQIGPWTATAGQKALDRVYVSDPLSPQTISGTVKMQLMTREYATTDNVDQLILLIKVVSGNGATLRGTLLALGNYASTAEFINNATHRNKKGADGDALSSVVCQEHDRIVVEIGYCNSVAGTTPEASAKYGENAADLPENETQTTDGAGWIEFSGDIAFSTKPNLDKQVAASGDDGRRYTGSNGFSVTGTFMRLGYSTSSLYYHQHGFARWTGVTIEGTINVSYIQVYENAGGAGTPELKIYGVDEDNPLAPTTAEEFDADPLTSAAVDWDDQFSYGTWEQSPSLNSIFQELVDSYTISNDAVMIQIKNDHGVTGSDEFNSPRTWDNTTSPANTWGPKLHIEYTAGGGPQIIYPAGIASAEAFGSPTVLPGAMIVLPTSIASAEVFGSPTLNLKILPSAIGSEETFGTPTIITGALVIVPSGIASGEAFGILTIIPGAVVVAPSGIPSGEAFGSPKLVLYVKPTSIESQEALGTPALVPGIVIIYPIGITSKEAFGTPIIIIVAMLRIERVEFRSPIMLRADFRSGLTFEVERSRPITTEVRRRSRVP